MASINDGLKLGIGVNEQNEVSIRAEEVNGNGLPLVSDQDFFSLLKQALDETTGAFRIVVS